MTLTPAGVNGLAQNIQVTIPEEEMRSAFAGDIIPANRDLFVKRFSPEWENLKVSEQLSVLASIASLVEAALEAQSLKVTAISAAVPKP